MNFTKLEDVMVSVMLVMLKLRWCGTPDTISGFLPIDDRCLTETAFGLMIMFGWIKEDEKDGYVIDDVVLIRDFLYPAMITGERKKRID